NYNISQSTGAAIVPGTSDIGNHGDDIVTTIALPFAYNLYGTPYTSANVSSNGTLQFVSNNNAWTNTCLPGSGFDTAIFPHWDDQRTDTTLTCTGGCGIYTSTSGTAPNRIFNIEWRVVYFGNTAQQANYEVRLYEGQDRF